MKPPKTDDTEKMFKLPKNQHLEGLNLMVMLIALFSKMGR